MRSIVAVVLLSLAACGTEPAPPPPFEGAAEPGKTYSLAHILTSVVPPGQSVTWAMVETDGSSGSVNAAGLYTAPSCAQVMSGYPTPPVGLVTGSAHVKATWPSGSTTLAVTISEAVQGIDVTPATTQVAPGATVQFKATIHCTCHSYDAP